MENEVVIQIPIDEIEFRCHRLGGPCTNKDSRIGICTYCTFSSAVTTTRLATPDEVAEIYIGSRNW